MHRTQLHIGSTVRIHNRLTVPLAPAPKLPRSHLFSWVYTYIVNFFFFISPLFILPVWGWPLVHVWINMQLGNYSVKLRSIPVNTLSLWNFLVWVNLDLNLNSTNLPRPWSPRESSPSGKNSHGRAGNRTRNLMISKQRFWPLDHEAGHIVNNKEM